MRSVLMAVLGLGVGIYLGLQLHPILNPATDSSSFARSTVSENDSSAQIRPLTNSLSFEQMALEHLKAKRLQPAVDYLTRVDFEEPESQVLVSQLEDTLWQLAQAGEWAQLQAWVESLKSQGLDLDLLNRLDAQLLNQQGSFLAAVETLYIAKDRAPDWNSAEAMDIEIENIVMGAVEAYNKSEGVDRTTLQNLLAYVLEKQPDYPPYGIELSRLLAEQGDLTAAIATLERIPEGSEFNETVVVLKKQYLLQKNNSENWGRGIPLAQVGKHFVVEVDINSEEGFKLLIDTGATFSVLKSTAVNRLMENTDLSDTQQEIQVNTANGSASSMMYTVEYFSVGGFYQENINIVEMELVNMDYADGLLGMDFLSRYQFEIDQDSHKLYLAPN